jgi:hypothetical protein
MVVDVSPAGGRALIAISWPEAIHSRGSALPR